MKGGITKTISCLCVLGMILTQTGTMAMSRTAEEVEEKTLLEKYPFDEKFKYSSEMIGYALQATVPKIVMTYEVELSYEPVIFDSEYFEDLVLLAYSELSDEYSEEGITLALIEYLEENIAEFLSYGRKKTIETSNGGTGSGVVISEEGYIATNAHVASVTEDTKKELYIAALEEDVLEDLEQVFEDVEEYGITLTDETMNYMYSMVLEDVASRVEIKQEEIELEVLFPTSDGATDLNSGIRYKAEVVEQGTQEGIEGLTQDTAILKIDAENLVALKLSESYPALNSEIVSAGFPAASDELFQSVGSDESVLSITAGTGQIARLVAVEDSDYKAIEITTAISGGNSGGPSVDQKLEIEGLNTYALSSDLRYAYMISAEYVADLAEDCDIEINETTKTFLLGLQMLQQEYGITATECFERVKELQPETPFIDVMIEVAEDAPQEEYPLPEEKESESKPQIPLNMIIIIVAGVVAGGAIVMIVVLIVKMSNKKKRDKQERDYIIR